MGQNTGKAGAAQGEEGRREERERERGRKLEGREEGRNREISVYHQEKVPSVWGKGTLLYC